MSDIAGELSRVREAFDKPTLRLLARKWSPFVLAVFRTSFSGERRAIAAERLHTQVDTYLTELRTVGEDLPGVNGRTLCLQWMNQQWLFRTTTDAGDEQYSLTSYAMEALDLVHGLTRDRALISESRINTIVDAVRQMATEANPDQQARLNRLDAQIAQLTVERDRVAAGGEIAAATDDRMLEGYANLIDLISQLPSDFKRVEESVLAMHRKIISDFRNEARSIGEVIDEYLAKTDELTTGTQEGRAFDGAFTLLRDDALLLELRMDLQSILDHPFADALTTGEQREFRGTVGVIRRGIGDVLDQRSRLTGTLRDHIENHDVIRDRELDAILRQINQQLEIWMRIARPRDTVPVKLIPEAVSVEHLRERMYDPGAAAPPPPLEDVSESAPEPLSMIDIRTQGGPLLRQLREQLVAAVQAGDVDTLGELFNALPAELRRPVEILGLLHVLAPLTDDTETRTKDASEHLKELFEAIRPDGSRRRFELPLRGLSLEDAAAVNDPMEGTRRD